MNPYRNAFRVLTRRYMDDFQFNEARFEEEDGPPIADDDDEHERNEPPDEIELKEAA